MGIALLGEIAWIASRNGYGWQIVISRQLQEQKRFDRDQREWQQPPPHHSLRWTESWIEGSAASQVAVP